MAFAARDGTADASGRPDESARSSTRSAFAFRRQFLFLTVALLAVNVVVGLFARHQQRAISDYAINIYDTAFISTNYVSLAQIAFQHFVDERAINESKVADLLDNVLDDMDVAIERSSSAFARAEAIKIRDQISAIAKADTADPAREGKIADVQASLEHLHQRNSDIGLKARDDIEAFSFKSDLLLFFSVLTSVVLAALALFAIHRAVNSLNVRSSDRLFTALEGMPQGLIMLDQEQRLIVCNTRFASMYDLGSELIEPGTPLEAILRHRTGNGTAAAGREAFLEDELAWVSESESTALEYELQDGRIIALSKAPLSTGGTVTIHMDVTEKRNSEKQISFLALHDALTGLANRVQLREHMLKLLLDVMNGGRASVLCLDLDNFKEVNDTLGHSVGDELLCAVAQRLRDVVNETGLVSRTGGDEFCIVQFGIEPPAAADLAVRVVETIGVPFEIGGHSLNIGASVGIAIAPDDGESVDQLLRNADLALYRAKQDGGGRFHFFELEMDIKAQTRRSLELDLRNALAADQFELHYQPVVSPSDKKITGFEALLRWNHPTRGRISPAEFIPLAEESGLIAPIGEWVVREACAEAGRWPSDLTIAVNVSPIQFRKKTLLSSVVSALAASGLSAQRLELEVTETALMMNNEETLAALHHLRDLGVRISMDDFGTGYSSLSYLRSFPFDKIKIDQSFVRDVSDRPDAIAIVRAVAGLGHSFGIGTIAEGVETQEQLDVILAQGCTEVQGYFFSRPIPAGEIGELLKQFDQHAKAA